MSDLIRRKDVIKLVNQFVFGVRKEQIYEAKKTFIKYIEKMPTAYDIDKVVEELGCDRCENCSFLEVCAGSKCCTRCHEKIIEIVKQGCVGTETIRDKAVKWNNNSSKKVPYEFIDYVEGKRDIEEAEDCCEWISASDGEFIQNPHTKRLYSNEPSMKNIYCNTCGKKIKVM